MLFDSHAHLQLIDYAKLNSTMDVVMANAKQAGVEKLLCVATHLDQFDQLLAIKKTYPTVSLSIGLHPNEEPNSDPNEVCSEKTLLELASNPNFVAIGETGLDYFRTKPNETWQQKRFLNHIHAAKALKKPLMGVTTRSLLGESMIAQPMAKQDWGITVVSISP